MWAGFVSFDTFYKPNDEETFKSGLYEEFRNVNEQKLTKTDYFVVITPTYNKLGNPGCLSYVDVCNAYESYLRNHLKGGGGLLEGYKDLNNINESERQRRNREFQFHELDSCSESESESGDNEMNGY